MEQSGGRKSRQGRTPVRPYEAWPVDVKILELLPDEGTIGGVHWKGRRAKAVRDEICAEVGQNIITTGTVSGRLRTMSFYGMTKIFPASGGDIWARTKEGKKYLNEHSNTKERDNAEPEVS